MSGLLTKKDVAAYLAVSERFVQRYRVELGGFALGGRLRFRREDIDRWLEQQRLARKGVVPLRRQAL